MRSKQMDQRRLTKGVKMNADSPANSDEPVQRRVVEKHNPDRWRLAAGAALISAGVGTLFAQPALLLVTVVCVGALALRWTTFPPEPVVAIERSFSTDSPAPGDVVEVKTTLTNLGESTLPDCRFVDLVPDELSVVAGSPRAATHLPPGARCTLEYEVELRRGSHRFEGVHAVVSDRAATSEHVYLLASEDEFRCRPDPESLPAAPLRRLTTPYTGRMATEKPGEGLEFHSVREYRRGDALRRIDWNQYASTRELSTLQFRTEQAAAVVLVADVRPVAYVRSQPAENHAADRCLDAVSRLFVTLLDADHRVGIATLGPDFWLAPNDGSEHRNRALDALASEPALSPSRFGDDFPLRLRAHQLLQRMPATTQVFLCTPLVDDAVEVPVQLLESAGHEVVVVSPDPTSMETAGGVVTALERRHRISRIHGYGVPVVDVGPEESLDVVLARIGWSR